MPKNLNWAQPIQIFIQEWLNGQKEFTLKTSGSTGNPKEILVNRDQMVVSAKATIEYLRIPENAKALLCMNPNMIGGKMMIVRALIGNWQLWVQEPSGSPQIDQDLDFAAMVPLQVENILSEKSGEVSLSKIDYLIIGGATISPSLRDKLQKIKTNVYQTYGMTETISHIALMKINAPHKEDHYRLIGDNQIKIDSERKLAIKGSVTKDQWIETNDLAELKGDGFVWLGRADLTINSGGVKISIEELEKELSQLLLIPVLVWKEPDTKFGEKVIGLIKSQSVWERINSKEISINTHLKKYHEPKEWFYVNKWVLTESGKIDRPKTYQKAIEKLNSSS